MPAPDTPEGEQLICRRYEAMMTLAQLAELTGFNKSTLLRWFRRPEVEMARRSMSERGEKIADTANAGEGDAAPRLEGAENVAPEPGWPDLSSPAD